MHACAHMQCVLALRMQQTLQLLLLLLLLLLLVCCSRTIVPDRAVQGQCVRPFEGSCLLKALKGPFKGDLKTKKEPQIEDLPHGRFGVLQLLLLLCQCLCCHPTA